MKYADRNHIFEEHGIEVPPTLSLRNRLRAFIINGNGASRCGKTTESRVAAWKEWNEKWVGKTVRDKTDRSERTGRVDRLMARTRREIGEMKREFFHPIVPELKSGSPQPLAFRVGVKWVGASRITYVMTFFLEIVSEKEQDLGPTKDRGNLPTQTA